MAPYLSEIRLFAQSEPPKGWALCDGQLLQIREHMPLFSLIGNTYGGDGSQTFALPDLRGAAVTGVAGNLNRGDKVQLIAERGDDSIATYGMTFYIAMEGQFPTER